MLRMIGAGVLLSAAVLSGVLLRRTDREHLRILTDSISLIRHARRKIDLFETPADSLFSDFSEGFDRKTRESLSEKTPADAISSIVAALGTDGIFLEKFVAEIGIGYKSDALRLCDYCITAMEDRRAAAEKEFSSRQKLYIALPLLLAVSVIVLLL